MTNLHLTFNQQQGHHESIRSGMPATAVLLFFSLLLWATTGTAQTGDNAQDLTLDTSASESDKPIAQTDPETVTAEGTSPGEEETDATEPMLEPETPPAEPVQVEAPSSKPDRLTSAIERFTPTEEISADNAVPFPVDI